MVWRKNQIHIWYKTNLINLYIWIVGRNKFSRKAMNIKCINYTNRLSFVSLYLHDNNVCKWFGNNHTRLQNWVYGPISKKNLINFEDRKDFWFIDRNCPILTMMFPQYVDLRWSVNYYICNKWVLIQLGFLEYLPFQKFLNHFFFAIRYILLTF